MKKLVIILDRAHGSNIAGKCSPDQTHREWQWSKKMCTLLYSKLKAIGYDVRMSAPEDTEPGLTTRIRRMNSIASPAFVLSLHNNAAGMGDVWKNAHGYSVWTTKGYANSDKAATILFNEIQKAMPEVAQRKDLTDPEKDVDYEANFTVLTSKHPSVMIEWMFQDNREDLAIIKSDSYNLKLANTITAAMPLIEAEILK